MKHLFLSLVILITTPTLAFAQDSAQSGLRLITSPLPVNLVTEPGNSVSAELKVKNDGTASENLKVTLMKFRAYEDSGKPLLEEPDGTEDFIKWVTVSDPTFTLAPNEWKTLQMTIAVPDTAAFGYYYAFVFSRAEDVSPGEAGQTALSGGVAILALLNVEVPNAKKEVNLESFTSNRNFYEFLPVDFSVSLKNTGNIHTAPRGNIFISRGTKEVALLEVNQEKGSILPSSRRIFEVSWADGFPRYIPKVENGAEVKDEEGNTLRELEWNWADAANLRFGKYTAKLVMIYDDGSRDVPLESEITFWVLPWRMMGAGVVIALFFLVGLRSSLGGLVKRLRGRKD